MFKPVQSNRLQAVLQAVLRKLLAGAAVLPAALLLLGPAAVHASPARTTAQNSGGNGGNNNGGNNGGNHGGNNGGNNNGGGNGGSGGHGGGNGGNGGGSGGNGGRSTGAPEPLTIGGIALAGAGLAWARRRGQKKA